MNSQKIALLTDTGTNTPASFLAEHDIRVAPLRINFSDATFESGVDITPAELVARLPHEVPKTSLPSPQTIRDLFEQARADGYERAVFVTLSSGLSATCQTVRMVASQMTGFPVVVVDSLSIGIAAGLVVLMSEALPQTMPFFLVWNQVALVLCAFVLISVLGSLATVIRVSKIDPAQIIGGDFQ